MRLYPKEFAVVRQSFGTARGDRLKSTHNHMQGEPVIVRVFGGKGLKRRVWSVGDSVVYITDNEQYDRLAAGKLAKEPIGFPKEDVFAGTEYQTVDDEFFDWSQLAL